ncbi:kinase-like protein [Pyrenochaeta sp. DS3sAY3a]|nr:kinase-like protein [Pyrenochaeta sp. DS3sAY3a]
MLDIVNTQRRSPLMLYDQSAVPYLAPDMSDLIQFPKGFGQQDIVAWGTTGLGTMIYERFEQRGGHRGLLRYHGTYESGIRLELAPRWNLSSFLRKHPETGIEQRMRWAHQITDALHFVHATSVVRGDLTLNNVLLTQDLHIKLAGFGGSSLGSSDLLASGRASHQYPGPLLSTAADSFFPGSVYYTIVTGKRPYQDSSEEEITTLFKEDCSQGKPTSLASTKNFFQAPFALLFLTLVIVTAIVFWNPRARSTGATVSKPHPTEEAPTGMHHVARSN